MQNKKYKLRNTESLVSYSERNAFENISYFPPVLPRSCAVIFVFVLEAKGPKRGSGVVVYIFVRVNLLLIPAAEFTSLPAPYMRPLIYCVAKEMLQGCMCCIFTTTPKGLDFCSFVCCVRLPQQGSEFSRKLILQHLIKKKSLK